MVLGFAIPIQISVCVVFFVYLPLNGVFIGKFQCFWYWTHKLSNWKHECHPIEIEIEKKLFSSNPSKLFVDIHLKERKWKIVWNFFSWSRRGWKNHIASFGECYDVIAARYHNWNVSNQKKRMTFINNDSSIRNAALSFH